MNLNGKYCLLTNDVETHSIWHNCLRDETGENVLNEGMPKLLEIYRKYDVQSTFFFTGYIAEKFPGVVKMILQDGHEVGSHGYSHKVEHGFDVMNFKDQVVHLKKSKAILEDLSGQEVISFRAPALRVNRSTPKALIEAGFKIDSSIASQRFDMLMSFGSKEKLHWLRAPRLPYKTKIDNLAASGEGPLVEVPLTATLLPYTSTTMRVFPTVTKMQRHIVNMETSFNGKPVVFDIHPNEFLNENEGRRKIKRRSDNFFSYLLKDYLRGKLKVKNLGDSVVDIYSDEILFYKRKGYIFTSVKQYCKEHGFLS